MSRQWGDGRYQARSLLGRGGTAEVWRAGDQLLCREVAVKSFVSSALTSGDDDATRFRTEIGLLARLDHPHVVRVLDAGAGAGPDEPWYAMPLARSGSLARPDAVRDPDALRRIGAQIADALAYLHGAGVVHRDVKPSNILLDGDERALLSDFGVAHLAGSDRITRTGLLVGTVAFLAPEQVRGVAVGPPADVYALGLVLLERLTGHREYCGPPAEAAVARLVRPPAVPAQVTPPWHELLTAMTASEPGDRPTAVQVRDHLAERRHVALTCRPPLSLAPELLSEQPPEPSRPARSRLPRSRLRGAPGVAAAGLVGAVGGGGLVALLLVGGFVGPLRTAPRESAPTISELVGPQAVDAPLPAPETTASKPVVAVRTVQAVPPPTRAPRTTSAPPPATSPTTSPEASLGVTDSPSTASSTDSPEPMAEGEDSDNVTDPVTEGPEATDPTDPAGETTETTETADSSDWDHGHRDRSSPSDD